MQDKRFKIRILGSGSSTGVPVLGCSCGVCRSRSTYNKRLRASILMQDQQSKEYILIDSSPDMRQQLLTAQCEHLDYFLLTHPHADHLHGIDDLRAFFFDNKLELDAWLLTEHLKEIKHRFSYLDSNKVRFSFHALQPVAGRFCLKNKQEVDYLVLPHGRMCSVAYRFGRFAYATDFKMFSKDDIARWQGKVELMVASGIQLESHPSHSSLNETLQLFETLGVKQGVISHLSHKVDYHEVSKQLPKHVRLAYDGMVLSV